MNRRNFLAALAALALCVPLASQDEYDPFKNRYRVGDSIAAGSSLGGAGVVLRSEGFVVTCNDEYWFELTVGYEHGLPTSLGGCPWLHFQSRTAPCSLGTFVDADASEHDVELIRTVRVRLFREIQEINLDRDGLVKRQDAR